MCCMITRQISMASGTVVYHNYSECIQSIISVWFLGYRGPWACIRFLHVMWCDVMWWCLSVWSSAVLVLGLSPRDSVSPTLVELHWLAVRYHIQFKPALLMYTFDVHIFAVADPVVFNAVPDHLRDPSVNTATFARSLKTHLFTT